MLVSNSVPTPVSSLACWLCTDSGIKYFQQQQVLWLTWKTESSNWENVNRKQSLTATFYPCDWTVVDSTQYLLFYELDIFSYLSFTFLRQQGTYVKLKQLIMYYSTVKKKKKLRTWRWFLSCSYGLTTVFADIGCKQQTHTQVVFNHISVYLVFGTSTSLHFTNLQKISIWY